MNYAVISGNEDGEVRFEVLSDEHLCARLDENDWGEDVRIYTKYSQVPSDLQQLNGLLIFPMTLVVPKAKEVTTKWVVDTDY